ncbi:serine hydrolase domain-containing protein [Thermocatellispora tengchongensis]|uniref:serine hydrolase domain-containing protein n=1 Tax=Thermocatellispora tengchongensis TaxID=1073253 RepID=UPI003636E79E
MTIRRCSTFVLRLGAATLAATLLAAGPVAAAEEGGLDRQRLRQTLDAVHEAGMYGIYSNVVDGRRSWKGAAGVADVETGRPVRPEMVHRAGSITKSFVAVAVLQQVGKGRIELDAPIGRYLPDLIPGERGQRITVRMLLNHTSHIANHTDVIFPTIESLDSNRFRAFTPEELARAGLGAPATGQPGATPGAYSNTNFVIAGLLLEKVTGTSAERYITDHVFRKAGLRHVVPAYAVPPWAELQGVRGVVRVLRPAQGLQRLQHVLGLDVGCGRLDDGRPQPLLPAAAARRAARRDTPRRDAEDRSRPLVLGRRARLRSRDLPLDLPCGRFWGHDGSVPGMQTFAFSDAGGGHQFAFGTNLRNYQQLDENGNPVRHAIDSAIGSHLLEAACGPDVAAATRAARPLPPIGVDGGTATP